MPDQLITASRFRLDFDSFGFQPLLMCQATSWNNMSRDRFNVFKVDRRWRGFERGCGNRSRPALFPTAVPVRVPAFPAAVSACPFWPCVVVGIEHHTVCSLDGSTMEPKADITLGSTVRRLVVTRCRVRSAARRSLARQRQARSLMRGHQRLQPAPCVPASNERQRHPPTLSRASGRGV